MGIMQNHRKTCILLKCHLRKIVGVTIGINKLTNATKRRVYQDLIMCLLQNHRRTCILLKRHFQKIVEVTLGINKLKNATKRRVIRDHQNGHHAKP